MNGRRPVALTSLFAVAMMLGGGGMGMDIPTRNPRAKVPPPDREPGCQCYAEDERSSSCPVHGPPLAPTKMDKAEAKRERKRQARLARQR